MVSTRPLISKSSSPCINPVVIVPRAPIKTVITVTFMFHKFVNSQASSRYLSSPFFFSFFFFFFLVDYCKVWSSGRDCSRRNFCLARNLIQRIISPNQDDLSYSIQTTFLCSSSWGKPSNTLFAWTTSFSVDVSSACSSVAAAAAWTQWGKPSNLWISCVYFS